MSDASHRDPLTCSSCGAALSPLDERCSGCKRQLSVMVGATLQGGGPAVAPLPPPPIIKPPHDAAPPWSVWFHVFLIGGTVIALLLVARVDFVLETAPEATAEWTAELRDEMRDPKSPSHIERARPLPTEGPALFFLDEADHPYDMTLAQSVVSGLPFTVSSERVHSPSQLSTDRLPYGKLLLVVVDHSFLGSFIIVRVYGEHASAHSFYRLDDGDFSFVRMKSRLSPWGALAAGLILMAAWLLRQTALGRYQLQVRGLWEAQQARRAQELFKAKQHLETARGFAAENLTAKAIVEVRGALAISPDYAEAKALYELLLHSQGLDAAVITSGLQRAESDSNKTSLFLRVVGTPYAYRADTEQSIIRIGRQRRAPDGGEQNDLVIRIPASDERTLRISRRHLDIHRVNDEYLIFDRSHGRTTLNGRSLDAKVPAKISTGDILTLGNTVKLEVALKDRSNDSESKSKSKRAVPLRLGERELELEATVGEMETEEIDD